FFLCVLCASVVKMLLILGLFILFLNQIIRCSRQGVTFIIEVPLKG
ncbi:MAG: hypothetical protein ACI9FJ_002772, partial [Alteromonadaceae bacterium]